MRRASKFSSEASERTRNRAAPPPALRSLRFACAYSEVKALGAVDSAERPQDRTDVARFYAVVTNFVALYHAAARQVSAAQGRTLSENARDFALLAIAACEVYMRPDDGARTLWQSDTTATSALWTGESGRSYAFVSIARDDAGNVEGVVAVATLPDTKTSVSATSGRLLNLSTRALCGLGDNVVIPSFVIAGTANKRLLIRAVGPTLADFGVHGVLVNPEMTLQQRVTEILYEDRAANDNWASNANETDIAYTASALGAFDLAPESGDAALLVDQAPGVNSVVARGVADTTGMILVDLLDADDVTNSSQSVGSPGSQLVNIANRGYCGTGEDVMISGFVVSPEGAQTLLVRVVGPTLGTLFALPDVLADPHLAIYRHEGVGTDTLLLSNNDWGSGADAETTAPLAAQIGAFPLPDGSKDAAFVLTLPPGIYTVVASGIEGTTDTALVEVYEAP